MDIPKKVNGMKLVKEYPSFALYERTYRNVYGEEYTARECFNYWDLGINTKQRKTREVHIGNHM